MEKLPQKIHYEYFAQILSFNSLIRSWLSLIAGIGVTREKYIKFWEIQAQFSPKRRLAFVKISGRGVRRNLSLSAFFYDILPFICKRNKKDLSVAANIVKIEDYIYI